MIGSSVASRRLINVAAIRSTGLSASLGIGAYVAELLPELGVELGEPQAPTPVQAVAPSGPWWRRTAGRHDAATI